MKTTLLELIDHGPQSDGGPRYEALVRHPHVANEMRAFYDTEGDYIDGLRDILSAVKEHRYAQFWIERGEPQRNAREGESK